MFQNLSSNCRARLSAGNFHTFTLKVLKLMVCRLKILFYFLLSASPVLAYSKFSNLFCSPLLLPRLIFLQEFIIHSHLISHTTHRILFVPHSFFIHLLFLHNILCRFRQYCHTLRKWHVFIIRLFFLFFFICKRGSLIILFPLPFPIKLFKCSTIENILISFPDIFFFT